MGRYMPTECEHGKVVDWGDFGPEDDSKPPECPICEAKKQAEWAANCAREKAIYRLAYSKGWIAARAQIDEDENED